MSNSISTALRWILLSINKKKIFLHLLNRDQMYCHIWTVACRSNGQILCHADARHCIPTHFQRNRKKTHNTRKWKLSHERKHFLLCKKKGFTTLPRKTGHPSVHVRAYATPKRHKIRPLEIPSSFISFMFIFSILFLK